MGGTTKTMTLFPERLIKINFIKYTLCQFREEGT